MDEDRFNMAIRKFLKEVGVTSQREIERVVRESAAQKPIDALAHDADVGGCARRFSTSWKRRLI